MIARLIEFLEYDEVTLFSLNFSYLIVFLLQPTLIVDLLGLLFASEAAVLLPLSLVYFISVLYGMVYSFRHILRDEEKNSREMFFMAGGGAILAVSAAVFALISLQGSGWPAKIPAIYSLLYNFLILWFMGLLPGLDVGEHFISKHDARRPEAVIALLVITVLAIVLKFGFEFPWWQIINACVFASLSLNKIVLFILHRDQARRTA